MEEKVFRVALVGCGAICGNHIKSILAAGQELCALCDIEIGRARAAAESHGLGAVAVYSDYVAMLEKEKPDAVHICTPHYLHAPMAVAALERDIHVLCEKPLCISMEQLAQLRAAAGASRARLGVCHQNRYEPNMLRLREIAAREGVAAACGYVVWKRDAAYYGSGAWRGTKEKEGGGVMINQALHTLDLLQWICGMPVSVTAHTFNDSLGGVMEVEDCASARFTLSDGRILNFFATVGAGADFPVRIELKTQKGAIVTATNGLLVDGGTVTESQKPQSFVGKTVWGDCHKALIKDFYTCLSDGTPFSVNIDEAEKVVRLILTMYSSNGKNIAVLR
ncbi:MAG: Gfo/Idh/MocA family protein [Eubacteriales bacterium]